MKIDFHSINTILQLLALMLGLLGFYLYRIVKNKNKTIVELYKLADKNDLARLIEKGKSEVFIPDNLSRNQQYDLVKEQVKQKHNQYKLRITIIIIFIALFFLTIILLIFYPVRTENENSRFRNLTFSGEAPVVIGIYPSDVFGPDQKAGLHAGIKNSGLGIDVRDLDFLTMAEMRSGKISMLLDSLTFILQTQNVLSIVGPSITECSNEVLELLIKLNSKVPIFITGAASKEFLKWDQLSKDLNLFRTGSGIDKRADLIANFLKEKDITRKSLFLIETDKTINTFGQLYYEALVGKSEILANAVKTHHIDTLHYWEDNFLSLKNCLSAKLSSYDFVFVLGVGRAFRQIVDTFYNPTVSKMPLPKIGGWMNSYSLNNSINSKEFSVFNKKVFEITDVNLSRARNYDARPDDHLRAFVRRFGIVHVGVRDCAISYDAAICISETYKSICDSLDRSVNTSFIHLNSEAHIIFADEMRNKTFEGILSKIIFSIKGINENVSLDCALFDSSKNNWVRTDIQDLLIL